MHDVIIIILNDILRHFLRNYPTPTMEHCSSMDEANYYSHIVHIR